MSLNDEVLYFTGEIDSLDMPARPLSWQHLLPARHSHTEQLEVKELMDRRNVTMSLAQSLASGDDNGKASDPIRFTMSNAKDTAHRLDDQRIKHSDDARPGLTRPIYYCTVGLLCLLWSLLPFYITRINQWRRFAAC